VPATANDITLMLNHVASGGQDEWDTLFTTVYDEVHRLAHAAMRREGQNLTLQTTALVHEAYLRFLRSGDGQWKNRRQFFYNAAKVMRRILVEKARRMKTIKRGGGKRPLSLNRTTNLDAHVTRSPHPFEDLEALDKALNRLESEAGSRRRCAVVELLYFAGLTYDETAAALGISKATVARDWEFVRVWLYKEMTA